MFHSYFRRIRDFLLRHKIRGGPYQCTRPSRDHFKAMAKPKVKSRNANGERKMKNTELVIFRQSLVRQSLVRQRCV